MAYTPPASNAVDMDLKPAGSPAVSIPSYDAVALDLAADDGGGGVDPVQASDNARLRNFGILLAI